MLELQSPPARHDERPPLHLALVVDTSGSMRGAKIASARQSARYLVEHLKPTDQLALIGFDSDVHLHATLGATDKTRLAAVIDRMRAGSMTNLSGGWLKGLEELGRLAEAPTRTVLLLSDGHANQGIVNHDELATIATGARNNGITTTTIGFGNDFDEELMTAIGDAGAGRSYYAASPEDAPALFAEEFDGLATLVAQNISVEITPTSDVKLLGILNEYPVTEVPDGLQIHMGDAFGDDLRRLVFELHIPRLTELGPRHVADIIVRYATVDGDVDLHETTIPLNVNAADTDTASAAAPDADVTEQVTILKAVRSRRDAQRLATEGRFDEADATLRRAAEALRAAAPESSYTDELLADADELEFSSSRMAASQFTVADKKRMHYESWSRTRSTRKTPPHSDRSVS
jgi:Ca-activated chloride channel family protein